MTNEGKAFLRLTISILSAAILSAGAGAAENKPNLPQKTVITPSFPKTLDQAKAEAEAAARPPATWSEAEITIARARCTAILKRINAIAIPEPPIKEGACGTPAPIQLISVGRDPEVSISPPAIVTCDLAESLAGWLKSDLQPLAKKHLGDEIIKIETMSSYSCRNAYGRKSARLSEHALANALDIRGFVTASAKSANVLAHWGTPQREVAARLAAEKAAAEKLAAGQQTATQQKAEEDDHAAETAADTTAPDTFANANGAKGTIIDGVPSVGGGTSNRHTMPSFSIAEPDRLGGPKPRAAVSIEVKIPPLKRPSADAATAQKAFLHAAHVAACRIFGTTLGPEANTAHRNHFHIDMAPRKVKKICD